MCGVLRVAFLTFLTLRCRLCQSRAESAMTQLLFARATLLVPLHPAPPPPPPSAKWQSRSVGLPQSDLQSHMPLCQCAHLEVPAGILLGGVFAQRGHSPNHYAVHPGKTPANHPPTHSGGSPARRGRLGFAMGGSSPPKTLETACPPPPPQEQPARTSGGESWDPPPCALGHEPT